MSGHDILPPFEEIHEALRQQFNSSTTDQSTNDPESRQRSLETELSELEMFNASLDNVIDSFSHCANNITRLQKTSDASINLLDRWVKILSETNSIKEKLLINTDSSSSSSNNNNNNNNKLTEEDYDANVDRLHSLEQAIRMKREEIQRVELKARKEKEEKEEKERKRREAMKRRLYGRKGVSPAVTPGRTPKTRTTPSSVGRSLFGRR